MLKPLSEMSLPLLVKDHPAFAWVGWFTLAISFALSLLSWQAGEWVATAVFGLLALMGLYLLSGSGRTEIDAQHIKRITPLDCYQIEWDEVCKVGVHGQIIVFEAKDKRLVIPGEMSVAAGNRKEMMDYIQAQIVTRGVKTAEASLWSLSKNTRTRC